MKKILSSRKFRQGSIATAITVLVLAIVVVLNMVVVILAQRYSLRLDLTPGKVFGISKDTTDFLSNLSQDVNIYVLNSQEAFSGGDQYLKQANEVIQKYTQYTDRIAITYVDLTRNSGFASQFPEENVVTNNILVVNGDRVRVLTPYDLFEIDSSNYYAPRITGSLAEQAMTSAIAGVTSNKTVTVAILGGHNEASLSGLRPLLELNNYILEDVNILTQEIPSEATIAILSAPLRDYTEEELKKLDRFLSNNGQLGKTFFYMAGVDQPETPALDAFLKEWNIQVKDGVVFETDQSRILNLSPYFPFVEYTEAGYSQSVQAKGLYVAVPTARPLDILEGNPDRRAVSLLQYSAKSGIQPLIVSEGWQPGKEDMVGPIPALVLSSQLKLVDNESRTSNVLVCGSSIITEEAILSSHTLGNSEYILSLLNALSQREDVIAIQSKMMVTPQLGLNNLQILGYSFVFVILLPLAMLITGGVVFFRRRNL